MYYYQKFLSAICAGVLVLGASSVPARMMATEAVQQSQTAVQVKGVVLDTNGQPVIGAGVIEVGTQGNGTVTGAVNLVKLLGRMKMESLLNFLAMILCITASILILVFLDW